MVWQLFHYDQANTIANSPALAGFGDGVCLALSMKWCARRKAKQNSLAFNQSVASEAQKLEIANWMTVTQDRVLEDLGNNPGHLNPMFNTGYRYRDDDGDPISTVTNVRGQINNMRAYANRLEKMSQWARSNAMVLLDDKVGFSANRPADQWVSQLIDASFRLSAPPVIGIIGLTGPDDGHALAYELTQSSHISFFDPNFGEFRSSGQDDFLPWFLNHILQNYRELNQHWWVVQFR